MEFCHPEQVPAQPPAYWRSLVVAAGLQVRIVFAGVGMGLSRHDGRPPLTIVHKASPLPPLCIAHTAWCSALTSSARACSMGPLSIRLPRAVGDPSLTDQDEPAAAATAEIWTVFAQVERSSEA